MRKSWLAVLAILATFATGLSADAPSANKIGKFYEVLKRYEYPSNTIPKVDSWQLVERTCHNLICRSFYLDPASPYGTTFYGAVIGVLFALDFAGKLVPLESAADGSETFNIPLIQAWNFQKDDQGYRIDQGERLLFDGNAVYVIPKGWNERVNVGRANVAGGMFVTYREIEYKIMGPLPTKLASELRWVRVKETYEKYAEAIYQLKYIDIMLDDDLNRLVVHSIIELGAPPIIRSRSRVK